MCLEVHIRMYELESIKHYTSLSVNYFEIIKTKDYYIFLMNAHCGYEKKYLFKDSNTICFFLFRTKFIHFSC